MDEEDRFDLSGGKMRRSHPAPERKYLSSVLIALARNNSALSRRSSRPRFKGTRIGRGGVAALALGSSDRCGGFRARRVFVQCRVVRFRGKALEAARSHLYYLQRDGVTREGEAGRLYSADEDRADGNAFIGRCAGDRHHFRLIIAADDGPQYEDLSPLIRRFMARMEKDLGTRLEWVAANHADTLVPHTHLVLRGRDEVGQNLVIAPAYIYHGMRERLGGIVSLDLGPRTGLEKHPTRLEVEAERLTSIDRRFVQEADDSLVVRSMGRDGADHAIRAGRLRKLESLGLATELRGGRWQLADDIETTLRRIAHRHDIASSLQRTLKSAGFERAASQRVIHSSLPATILTGRVVARGLADDTGNTDCLIIDGVDGKAHYIEIGEGSLTEPLPQGAIIRVEPFPCQKAKMSRRDLRATLISPFPLEHLSCHDGATWLDEELISPAAAARDQGFGREVRAALAQRRVWLIGQGLASLEGDQLRFRADMLTILRLRGVQRAALTIAKETGLEFRPAREGSQVEGILRRRVVLPSGKFALIGDGHQFSLVPWRPVLRGAIGEPVCARVHSAGEVSWTIGRSREIEL